MYSVNHLLRDRKSEQQLPLLRYCNSNVTMATSVIPIAVIVVIHNKLIRLIGTRLMTFPRLIRLLTAFRLPKQYS